jgi:hypothetical protein
MASRFMKRQVKTKSDPLVQKHEPERSFEPTIIQSNLHTFALESLSKLNPITANKKAGNNSKLPQDGQTPPKSLEEEAGLDRAETEDSLEGEIAVDPVSSEDHDPPKQLGETIHTVPVEEQQTNSASKSPWTTETYSQRLWDIAYDRLKNESPDVVQQYELNIMACNRATTDEKQRHALGQFSHLIRTGFDSSESSIPSRSVFMEVFLDRFLSRPATRTPEKPDSQSQLSDNTSMDEESLSEVIERLGDRLVELIRVSKYATIPWVASILALEVGYNRFHL